jgi:hypothetical protein
MLNKIPPKNVYYLHTHSSGSVVCFQGYIAKIAIRATTARHGFSALPVEQVHAEVAVDPHANCVHDGELYLDEARRIPEVT